VFVRLCLWASSTITSVRRDREDAAVEDVSELRICRIVDEADPRRTCPSAVDLGLNRIEVVTAARLVESGEAGARCHLRYLTLSLHLLLSRAGTDSVI